MRWERKLTTIRNICNFFPFSVLLLCCSTVLRGYCSVSFYFLCSLGVTKLHHIAWHIPFNTTDALENWHILCSSNKWIQLNWISFKSEFQSSVVKPKPKFLWPIKKDGDNLVNQSKLEVISRNQHKAQENVYARAMIGFGFTSDWLKKWHENFEPITEWMHSIENRSMRPNVN